MGSAVWTLKAGHDDCDDHARSDIHSVGTSSREHFGVQDGERWLLAPLGEAAPARSLLRQDPVWTATRAVEPAAGPTCGNGCPRDCVCRLSSEGGLVKAYGSSSMVTDHETGKTRKLVLELLADGGWHGHRQLVGELARTSLSEHAIRSVLRRLRNDPEIESENRRASYLQSPSWWYRLQRSKNG